MPIESKKNTFKKKVNSRSHQSKAKYLNSSRIKSVKGVKTDKGNKYISDNIKGNNRHNKQVRNKIRTQRLSGNVSSNIKDSLRENDDNRQPDVGIQAVINLSDKVDTANDVIYSSKRVISSVRVSKEIINSVKEKGSIDKKALLKQLSVNGAKAGFRTARNINTQLSNQFQSEDSDLGVRSFAEAEKEVRKSYDTAVAVRNTSSDIADYVRSYNSRKARSNEHFKNKIYSEKTSRYNRYKNITQKNEIIKSGKNMNTSYGNKTTAYRPTKIKTSKVISNKATNYRSAAMLSNVSTILSNASKDVIRLAKKAVMLILPGKKVILFLLICAVAFFLFVNSASSSLVAALSQQYFMTDNGVAENYRNKVEILDSEMLRRISDLADDDSYDDVRIDYIGDMQGVNTNFQELFAVAAVKFEQDLTYSTKEDLFIEEMYEELYDIKVSSEIYLVPVENDEEIEKIRKIITVYSYDMDTIMSKFRFDEEQKAWARRLVSGFSEQFPEFAQQYGELTQEEIIKLRENAPNMSNTQQKKLYDTALSIVGKVKYFWGGKSQAGWNDDWGESTKVTAKGSDTTGTYRPFGLDCSGYVDWVYKTAGIGNMLSGGGTAYQFKQSYPIREDELQVGDLAFLQMPNSSGINHVGIYIGKDDEDNNLYAHSEWGTGVTVNSFKGFKYFRRVVNFEME